MGLYYKVSYLENAYCNVKYKTQLLGLKLCVLSSLACGDDCVHDALLQDRVKTGLMSHQYLANDSLGSLRTRTDF